MATTDLAAFAARLISQESEHHTAGQVSFLRLPKVIERTGLSRATIYLRVADGSFPRPVSLGARAVAWIAFEVDEWIQARIKASRGNASEQLRNRVRNER
jgi:prophage regulatory protein